MKMSNDINDFVPSILNPRTVNKEKVSLTQNSVVSRCSLSLKRNIGLARRNPNTTQQTVPAKKKLFNLNNNSQQNSRVAPRAKSISTQNDLDISGFEELDKENDISQSFIPKTIAAKHLNFLNNVDLANASTVNLSSDDFHLDDLPIRISKENVAYWDLRNEARTSTVSKSKITQDRCSLDFSVFEDLPAIPNSNEIGTIEIKNVECNISLKSGSSATQLNNCEDTILHELNEESHVSISFGIQNCDFVDLTTKNTNIKKVQITRKNNNVNLDCEIAECTPLSSESDYDENMNETLQNPLKRSGVAVNLEIKKKKVLYWTVPAKKKLFNLNNNSQQNSRVAPRAKSISTQNDLDISGFEELDKENDISQSFIPKTIAAKHLNFLNNVDLANASTVNLSSDDFHLDDLPIRISKENVAYWDLRNEARTSTVSKSKITQDRCSLDFSVFEDLPAIPNSNEIGTIEIKNVECNISLKSGSSATQLNNCEDTILHELNEESHVSISFGIQNCDFVDLTTKNTNIKKVQITRKNNNVNLDCEIAECTPLSSESDYDENMNETLQNPLKRSGVAVNLEIKKKKVTDDQENGKVLILKTDAIDKLSHVIVQPQNCKLVKRHLGRNKFESNKSWRSGNNGKSDNLRQVSIDSFLTKDKDTSNSGCDAAREDVVIVADATEMNKIGASDLKCVRQYRSDCKGEPSPRCRVLSAPKHAESRPDQRGVRVKNTSARSNSPRIPEPILSAKTKSNRTLSAARAIPHHKIVAGTHFAVDAFSYGDIPNVKHYFLTHFHSDHYSGLKKTFNKLLYCSKITADLCMTRLGVSSKCIHVLSMDETTSIDGVDVTAVDANHCPGAVMLVFGLPNGKTILHTGDFRATPAMESYPLFWNSDIHTIYLDTTYCNPRYDFPTQEQSLEMALALLRQKKITLEKVGKKFSSVLIVCGTYTIGKEKFFLGMARRVGCSVWACPEKDKVLQAVEGRSFCFTPAQSCQLHVVPMRDLSYDKLKSYLESLQGAFSEVVAFKPSGWENGKNSTIEKDNVTIHGIPYSEHSSFSELIRFVKFLKPKQVVPTVDISGGVKAVQKYFPCPLVHKEDGQNQSKVTDYFSIANRTQIPAVT